jgi:ATP-binding cassette subfamily F protein 3
MRAKDVLLEALSTFTGTVVFVSHDRYFIDKVATRVFEIEGGQVTVYPGNYEDYLWRKAGGASPVVAETAKADNTAAAPAAVKPQKKMNPIKLQKLQERVAEIEKALARVEAEAAELAGMIGKKPSDASRLAVDLGGMRARIAELETEWEVAASELEAAQS